MWLTIGLEGWLVSGKTTNAARFYERLGRSDFSTAANWGREHHRPIYLGEFGAYSKAGMTSRALWTRAVRVEAQRQNFSPAYWEFCSGFGLYDATGKEWNEPLLNALLH